MKTNKLMLTITAAVLLIGVAGCDKKDSAVQQDLNKAATDAGDAVKNATDAVKQAGETAAKDVTKKAEELAAPVNAKAQEIIDGAKKLVSDGKLQDALAKLKELSSEKLSTEQQALADGLKTQIDKLLGTTPKTPADAAAAAGNLTK